MNLKRILPNLLNLAFLAFSALAWAKAVPSVPEDYVFQEPGLPRSMRISAGAVRTINQVLSAHENATTDQIIFAFFNSLEGEDPVNYVQKVFGNWRLGQKEKKNGVLIAVFIKERKARIEVGYGLEPILTDAMSKRVLDQSLLPQLKAGRPDQAVVNATAQILDILKSPILNQSEVSRKLPTLKLPLWVMILFFVVFGFVGIFILPAIARDSVTLRGRRRMDGFGGLGDSRSSSGRSWGGGGGSFGGLGGGGFGGGGGGSSGGGGASGDW